MNKLLLLDAYALIYRAFYAMTNTKRTNSKGFDTSTTFGFVNTLLELLKKEEPTHIGVAFDPTGPTFRHIAFPAYKAQREKAPEGIPESIPIIKEILKAFRIPSYEIQGYEADDVIGTLSKQAEAQGFQTVMVTPDKDYCQLVTNNVILYKPSHGKASAEILGPNEVSEKYGLDNPLQVIDMLGLQGDSSDNVPGCPGMGPKTSAALIKQYGSIERIYEHINDLKGKIKENLLANKEQVEFSKFLVTIKRDVPVILNEEDLRRKELDTDALRKIFEELEFHTLLKRVCGETDKKISSEKENYSDGSKSKSAEKNPTLFDNEPNLFNQNSTGADTTTNANRNIVLQNVQKTSVNLPTESPNPQEKSNDARIFGPKWVSTHYEIVDNKELRAEIIAKIFVEKKVSIIFSTTSQNAIDAKIIGLALLTQKSKAWYIPIEQTELFNEDIIQEFKNLFEDEQIEKIGYNLKFAMLVLANNQIDLKGDLFDVMLAHYVLQPEQQHTMDFLAKAYFQTDAITLEKSFGPHWRDNRNMEQLSTEENAAFAAQQVDFAFQLKPLLQQELYTNCMDQLFKDIEMPLVRVLKNMEFTGVRINQRVLADISKLFSQRLKEYEQNVYEISGKNFNLSSPKQVGEVLFNKMGLDEKAKRTKTGQYETSEATLEALRKKSPVIEQLLNYRAMKKLLSTYVDALPALVNKRTGHIHTSFNQAVTATGRLSSSNPNLQNIPVRGEDGKEIRKAFIPERGCEFFSADYSQIELRIMAHLSNDCHMIQAFNEGLDIHTATASKIFHKTINDISSNERRKAKTANFGIIYGISPFGLSQRMDISRSEAKELIDNYFKTFPDIKNYIERIIQIAHEQGYVETLFNRRRYLPDINSRNASLRSFSERNAVNAPIQGSAADIIKIAMIRIDKRFHEENLHSKMILQVHDELNFSVMPEEKKQVEEIVQYEMAHAYQLKVPLLADCGWGQNWLEAH